MTHATEDFRQRYRAGISPRYSGPLHATWVASIGIAVMIYAASQLDQVSAAEWLVLLFTLLLGNVGEYSIHKKLGHQKWPPAKLFTNVTRVTITAFSPKTICSGAPHAIGAWCSFLAG